MSRLYYTDRVDRYWLYCYVYNCTYIIWFNKIVNVLYWHLADNKWSRIGGGVLWEKNGLLDIRAVALLNPFFLNRKLPEELLAALSKFLIIGKDATEQGNINKETMEEIRLIGKQSHSILANTPSGRGAIFLFESEYFFSPSHGTWYLFRLAQSGCLYPILRLFLRILSRCPVVLDLLTVHLLSHSRPLDSFPFSRIPGGGGVKTNILWE